MATSFLVTLFFMLPLRSANSTELDLSIQEEEWLNTHNSIRISGPQAFPPFQYIDPDGSFKGMASDYIFHIAKAVGLNIEMTPKKPWPEILTAIKNKDIDLLTCAAITKERSNYLNFTEPHLSFPLVIISQNHAPFISGLQGLHNKSVAIPHKNSTIEWLKRDNVDVVINQVDSPLAALKAVSLGTVDATIENLAAATYLIEKNGLSNLKIASPTSYGNYSLSIAIRNDWPELITIMNKALIAMTVEEHNEIRNRWVSVRYEEGIVSLPTILKWLLLATLIALTVISLFYYWNRKLKIEICEREKVEQENQTLIKEMRTALDEIQTLRGIIPICAHCKKIRDDKGTWNQIELYLRQHSEAEFTHGICQDCADKFYPELNDEK